MIDIEERALRAFKQNALARIREFLKNLRNVGRYGFYQLGGLERLVERRGKVDRFRAEIILEQEVVIVEHFAELRCEVFTHEQIRHLERAS